MVQRASKVCEQVHLQFGNRPCGRVEAYSFTAGSIAQENHKVQQEAVVQAAENGEHFYSAQVHRKREHSLGQHR